MPCGDCPRTVVSWSCASSPCKRVCPYISLATHLGVDVLVKMLPPKCKKVVNLLIDLIEIAVLLMLTYVSAQYVMNSWHRVTDVLMMPSLY